MILEGCDVVCHCETAGSLLSRMTLHSSETTYRISVLIVLSSFIIIVFITNKYLLPLLLKCIIGLYVWKISPHVERPCFNTRRYGGISDSISGRNHIRLVTKEEVLSLYYNHRSLVTRL